MNATRLRNIRVPDELWDAAKAKAESEGAPLSEVIRHFLSGYVGVCELCEASSARPGDNQHCIWDGKAHTWHNRVWCERESCDD
jgi:hypothetical protein